MLASMTHRFAILLLSFLFLRCAATGPSQIKTDSRKTGDIESITMVGNYLDFYLNQSPKPYRCLLNPAVLKTTKDTYFSLKFSSANQTLPFELKGNDSLFLRLNDNHIFLPTLDVSRIGKKYSAYYRIEDWDLIDIGHTDQVQVYFMHGDSVFKAVFSQDNISKYQYFTAKYILNSTKIPLPEVPVYKQPWGFTGVGAGALYQFWLAQYTNYIQTHTGLGDYLAVGVGYAPFFYTEWQSTANPAPGPIPGVIPIEGWVELNQSSGSSYCLNLMYGLTHPSPFGRWSLEAGICFYYFFSAARWQDEQIRYLQDDYLTIIDSGQPYEGFTVGGFIQIGGFWFQLNSKNWTAGISVPVPWW